ncbi:carbon-nitrogen hydrolase [Clohesyomyces aquaticus]|uniref:Carbon-nitrogen hydrolase n=1 Tax=Clohesyomyces aquaticus TaxID=1231657 RepID=A0A1Y2A5U3_9PLEO|nr:carbon-nitrogen hydrolase [Clohesyomyces aquaticus]
MAPRTLLVAAAQVGAVNRDADKEDTVQRMVNLLDNAISQKVQLVVFPETTFTTFFPRFLFEDASELEKYFEQGDDITGNEDVKPLFDLARSNSVDICVGYGERTEDGRGFNTCIYYSGHAGKILSKYRKVHLPGTSEPFPNPNAVNQLEKRYFKPGDLGFQAFRAPGLIPDTLKKGTTPADIKETLGKGDPILGMMICNDRRWPEAWRVYGLQGVELIMVGYNTPWWAPDLFGFRKPMSKDEAEKEAYYHHKLVMEANSYMNACYSISAARAGFDDGKYGLIGGSAIVSPNGYTIAQAKGIDDELVVAEIDFEDCRQGKEKTFDFDRHRRTEAYGLITSQTGVVEPKLLGDEAA